MSKIRFLSIDSSLRNTGIAHGFIENGVIQVDYIGLVETEKTTSKQVRASSDTVARCRKTYNYIKDLIETVKPQVIFAETPSGSQNSSAMKSYGATCQLLAALSPAPIEVTPHEVKMASVGKKTASKRSIIDWASERYPDLDWIKGKKFPLADKNEHMADAISITYAGINTDVFKQLEALLKNSAF